MLNCFYGAAVLPPKEFYETTSTHFEPVLYGIYHANPLGGHIFAQVGHVGQG